MSEENSIGVDELELFESMLGLDFTEIEDLPEFVTPPKGKYRFKCEKSEVGTNKDKTKGAIKCMFSILEVLEFANPDEAPADLEDIMGGLISQQYIGSFGIQKFKQTFENCFELMGVSKPREFIDQMQNNEFIVDLTLRADPDGKTNDAGEPLMYPTIRLAVPAE